MKARFSGASSTTSTVLLAAALGSISLNPPGSRGEEALAHRAPGGVGRAAHLVDQGARLVAAPGLARGLEAAREALHAGDAEIARSADQVVRLARQRREVGRSHHRLDALEPADRAV